MLDSFETASGTTAGNKHRRGQLEPNQDAVLVHGTDKLLTLSSADGCGSSRDAHVASTLQVDWFTQMTHLYSLTEGDFDEEVWQGIAEEMGNRIRLNASWSHLSVNDAVARYWSATILGIVMGPKLTHFVAFGDGRFVVNGELIVIKAANEDENQPAYPGYLVASSTLPETTLKFTVLTRPTEDIEHALVATDGLDYLIEAEGKLIPGTTDRIPGLSYFWENDELFADPLACANWLNYAARDIRKTGNVLSGGKLYDDIAIASVRRKKNPEA